MKYYFLNIKVKNNYFLYITGKQMDEYNFCKLCSAHVDFFWVVSTLLLSNNWTVDIRHKLHVITFSGEYLVSIFNCCLHNSLISSQIHEHTFFNSFILHLQVLQPPAGYIPIRTPARKLIATPTPMAGTPTGFRMQTPDSKTHIVDMQPKGNLPMMKPDDMQYFDKLLVIWFL